MCGRFSVNSQQIDPWIEEHLEISFQSESNDNLCPTQTVSTITHSNKLTHQVNSTWGIKPGWSKKILINAQAETAGSKKTFKQAFEHKRCIVPCTGWFEWKKIENNKKQKYSFQQSNKAPLFMAGILFQHDDNHQLVTLTTRPNRQCAEIHHRMPVLIKPEDIDFWLTSSVDEIQPLIEPEDSAQIVISTC